MQNLSDITYHKSEQHKDTTQARKEHDYKDTNKIIGYLSQRNPFTSDSTLRSIATGIAAEEGVIIATSPRKKEKNTLVNDWKEYQRLLLSKERAGNHTGVQNCSTIQRWQRSSLPTALVSKAQYRCYHWRIRQPSAIFFIMRCTVSHELYLTLHFFQEKLTSLC